MIGTRSVAVSSISLEAISTQTESFSGANVYLSTALYSNPITDVTPEYSIHFTGVGSYPGTRNYSTEPRYPFEFTANNKQAVLDALSECVSYCNSTSFRISIAPIREDRQTIDSKTSRTYITVQVTEVTDNAISDISLIDSSIYFTETGDHPIHYISVNDVSYV